MGVKSGGGTEGSQAEQVLNPGHAGVSLVPNPNLLLCGTERQRVVAEPDPWLRWDGEMCAGGSMQL